MGICVRLAKFTTSREVDISIEVDQGRVFKLDSKTEIGEGLNSNIGGKSEPGILRVPNFRNSGQDLRLETENQLFGGLGLTYQFTINR